MRGAGFCNTLGRFMTILTPQITTALFASAGIVAVLAFVVSLLVLQAIVVFFLGIENQAEAAGGAVGGGDRAQQGRCGCNRGAGCFIAAVMV